MRAWLAASGDAESGAPYLAGPKCTLSWLLRNVICARALRLRAGNIARSPSPIRAHRVTSYLMLALNIPCLSNEARSAAAVEQNRAPNKATLGDAVLLAGFPPVHSFSASAGRLCALRSTSRPSLTSFPESTVENALNTDDSARTADSMTDEQLAAACRRVHAGTYVTGSNGASAARKVDRAP